MSDLYTDRFRRSIMHTTEKKIYSDLFLMFWRYGVIFNVMVLFLTQMTHHRVINEKGSQNTLKLTLWNPLKRRGSGIASTEGRRGSAPLRQSRSRGVAHLGRMVKFMKFRN